MATTTNYGWTTPDDTALVKDGAAAIRSLGTAIDTTTYNNAQAAIAKTIVDAKGDIVAASAADTPARLAVGTDNQRLVAASGEATGLKYVGDTQNTVIDAKGDLLVGSAADTLARLAVGTNDYVLTADSTATNGIKWAAASGGGYTLLSTTSLSGATVNITGISGSYKHLQIFITGVYGAGNDVQSRLRFNNDSGSNYDYGAVGVRIGNGDVISSRSSISSTSTQGVSGYTGTAFNQKNYMLIDIPRYTDTSPHFFAWTLWSVDNSTNTNWISWTGNGIYSTSSAISEVNLITQYANFSGGTVYIYGVN